MAEIIKTQAFLLHEIPYSDSSKICYFLTPSHGVIHLIAKGARKPKSKFSNQLSPFTLSEIIYSYKPTREIQTLQDITLLDSYKEISVSPAFFVLFSVFGELILKVIQEGEDISIFFQHIMNVLLWLKSNPQFLTNAVINLLIAIPTQLGFRITLNKCGICGFSGTDRNGFIILENGTWICSSCKSSAPEQKTEIHASLRKAILAVVPVKRLYQNTIPFGNNLIPELGKIISEYIGFHLHKPIKLNSLQVLQDIINYI